MSKIFGNFILSSFYGGFITLFYCFSLLSSVEACDDIFCECFDHIEECFNYDELEEFAPIFREFEAIIDASENDELTSRGFNVGKWVKKRTY